MASTYTTRLRLEKQGTGEMQTLGVIKLTIPLTLLMKLCMDMLQKVLQVHPM